MKHWWGNWGRYLGLTKDPWTNVSTYLLCTLLDIWDPLPLSALVGELSCPVGTYQKQGYYEMWREKRRDMRVSLLIIWLGKGVMTKEHVYEIKRSIFVRLSEANDGLWDLLECKTQNKVGSQLCFECYLTGIGIVKNWRLVKTKWCHVRYSRGGMHVRLCFYHSLKFLVD